MLSVDRLLRILAAALHSSVSAALVKPSEFKPACDSVNRPRDARGVVVVGEPGVPGMVQFDFREIDLASESDAYSQQEIVDIRMLAQIEMLRCRRRAGWCQQRMVTLALVWALLATLFQVFDVVGGWLEMVVLVLVGTLIVILRRNTQAYNEARTYCAHVDRSFSEVCVEHYCEIDCLCREHPAVARYVDAIAASGRVLTYYELRHLPRWAERLRQQGRSRKSVLNALGASIASAWPRHSANPSVVRE